MCELICDGLFINWKFGFDSDHQLHDLKLLYLSFSTLYSSSLWRTDTIIVSKLNRPPSPPPPPPPPPPPSLLSSPSNGLEINKPLEGLNIGVTISIYYTVDSSCVIICFIPITNLFCQAFIFFYEKFGDDHSYIVGLKGINRHHKA